MVEEYESTEVSHVADAALLVWSGVSYGHYFEQWVADGRQGSPITISEWMEGEKTEPYLHEAVAKYVVERRNQ